MKKNHKRTESVPNLKDRIAVRLVSYILRFQRGWASCMSRWIERKSVKGKKVTLFSFCLITGGISIVTIALPFFTRRSPAIQIDSIKTSEFMTKNGDEATAAPVHISETEYQLVKRFHWYLDSLANTKTGKSTIDSLLKVRPGLLDSARQLQQLYRIQKSKK